MLEAVDEVESESQQFVGQEVDPSLTLYEGGQDEVSKDPYAGGQRHARTDETVLRYITLGEPT